VKDEVYPSQCLAYNKAVSKAVCITLEEHLGIPFNVESRWD
jgi:hypothetical protein